MNDALVDRIARAVLYEGYILYPYRPSVKNRQRWTFGGICPRAYSEAHDGADPWSMQTQCLLVGGESTTLEVKVRFLHLTSRTVGQLDRPTSALPASGALPPYRTAESLEIAGRQYQTWQEAVEREVILDPIRLGELCSGRSPSFAPAEPGYALAEPSRPLAAGDSGPQQGRRIVFRFPAGREVEPLRDEHGQISGVLLREQQPLSGSVDVSIEQKAPGVFQLTVLIRNKTPLEEAHAKSRDEAMLHSLASTHTVLGVRDGEFVSLMDPPPALRELAAACQNVGTWPVLVGQPPAKDTMLSSPIVLYDYPEIAPESPGDLFDGTEIDEILSLRILTLTDDEKRQAAELDPRAAALLERTESLAREQLMNLHGAFRGVENPAMQCDRVAAPDPAGEET